MSTATFIHEHQHLHSYRPDDHECEKASNSYLMSLLAIMVGMPLPIVNLIATFIFFLGNRKSTYFVRWHCTQALLSQVMVLVMNSVGFSWTMRIIFTDLGVTNSYISYIITVAIFNLAEIIATIYAAQQVRKGHNVKFWLFGTLTDMLCRK
jgi:uncharacterized Tic20 family protein